MQKKAASGNPPFVLSGIPLSGRPGYIQVCFVLLGLAPLGAAFSLQYRDLQVINHHNHLRPTGYHFCSGARRLRLIIANSSACFEGGVSSLSSNPHTSFRKYKRRLKFNYLHFTCWRTRIIRIIRIIRRF